jgi:hypothetical protein
MQATHERPDRNHGNEILGVDDCRHISVYGGQSEATSERVVRTRYVKRMSDQSI